MNLDPLIKAAHEKGYDAYFTGEKNQYRTDFLAEAWRKGWLQAKTRKSSVPAAMKPNRKDVGYYMRLSAEDKAFLLKMGGVRWIRKCIELAREGETK